VAAPVYKNPYHFGLVVGIDRYPDITLGHLRHARRDAKAFYHWLTDADEGGSVPPAHCELLAVEDNDIPDGTPRKRAIPACDRIDLLTKTMGDRGDALYASDRKAWEQSRLYYYVSGHGLGKGTNDAMLLAANAGSDWLGLHVSCDRVRQYFARLQSFRELVIFADCCRDEKPSVEVRPLPYDRGLSRNRGGVWTAVCFGARPGEKSLEPPQADDRRGYFTEAVLGGLKGGAAPRGKEINAVNLADYVGLAVRESTQERQRADIQIAGDRPLVFRPAAPAVVYKVVLCFGAFAGQVQLKDGDLQNIGAARVVARGEEWEVALPTGLYVIEAVPAEAAALAEKGQFMVLGDCRVKL
jgi:hypothetical protein